MFFFRGRGGNALILLLPFVIFLLIFGWSLIERTAAEHTQVMRQHMAGVAAYLAEGAASAAVAYVRNHLESDKKFRKKFIEKKGFEKYSIRGELSSYLQDLINEFGSDVAVIEDVSLEFKQHRPFKYDRDDRNEKVGVLQIEAIAAYGSKRSGIVKKRLVMTKDIKVVSVVPPAQDYTLFVNDAPKDPEEVNRGGFIDCRNRDGLRFGRIRLTGHNIIWLKNLDCYAVPYQYNILPYPSIVYAPASLTPGGEVYGGIPKTEGQEDLTARTHSKLLLYGYHYAAGPLKEPVWPPAALEGKVEKKYRVYKYDVEIPNPSPPPPVLGYTFNPLSYEERVEPYKGTGSGGTGGGPDPVPVEQLILPYVLRLTARGIYERATFVAESFDPLLFERNGAFQLRGIYYYNNVELKSDLKFSGGGAIVADNMFIFRGADVSPVSNEKKNILSLMLFPEKDPMAKMRFEDSMTGKKVEAYLYSKNGVSGEFSRFVNVYGNFVCDKLDMENMLIRMRIYYRAKGSTLDEDERYAVVMSPTVSSFYFIRSKGEED